MTVGDLDGDGDLDIAVTNSGTSSVSVFLNNGPAAFTPATGSPFAVGVSPGGVVMGDFDEDGDLDISTANFGSNTTSVLINTAAFYSVTSTLSDERRHATGRRRRTRLHHQPERHVGSRERHLYAGRVGDGGHRLHRPERHCQFCGRPGDRGDPYSP